jgi:transposase
MQFCMPTKHRCRCSHRARRKRTAPISGPTPRPQTAAVQGVVYDFQPSRSGQACRDFLADWQGKLVCDDYQGYKAGFTQGITEAGCWAHARRKFFELSERGDSPIADKALQMIGMLYDVEREITEKPPDERRRIRQAKARPHR